MDAGIGSVTRTIAAGNECAGPVGHRWLVTWSGLARYRFLQPLGHLRGSVATHRFAGVRHTSGAQAEEELDRSVVGSRGGRARFRARNDSHAGLVDRLCRFRRHDVAVDLFATHDPNRGSVCNTAHFGEYIPVTAETQYRFYRQTRSVDKLAPDGLARRV